MPTLGLVSVKHYFNSDKCGGRQEGTINGIITSPGYPDEYGSDMYCQWTIVPNPQHLVQVVKTRVV